jgi:hypothetical protein
MSIINHGRAPIKSRPAPVQSTTLLFDCTWKTVIPKFGEGVRPRWVPCYRVEHTVEDEREAITLFNDVEEQWDSDEALAQREFESACIERYQRGYVGF